MSRMTNVLGNWAAQPVKRLTLAQVTISRFVGSSPASGSVLRAQSLEPALDSVSPSLSLPFLCSISLSLSLSKINIYVFILLMRNAKESNWGTWLPQSVEHVTPDLRVCEFEPRIGLCAESSEPGDCFRFCLPQIGRASCRERV